MQKLILAVYVATTSVGLIILKIGSNSGSPISYIDNKISFNFNLYSISGILLYGLSFIIYMYLISKYDLGYIIPLTTALVYTIIFVASFFIFKEAFTILKIVGITFIILGIIFINIGSGKGV